MRSSAFFRYFIFSIKIQGRELSQIVGVLFFLFLPFLFFFFLVPGKVFYSFLFPLFLCSFFLSNMVGFLNLFEEDRRENFLETLFLFPGLSLTHVCCVKAFIHMTFLGLPSLLMLGFLSIGSEISLEVLFFLFLLGFLILVPLTFWGVFFAALSLHTIKEFWVQAFLLFPFYMPLCFLGASGVERLLKGEDIYFLLLGLLGLGLVMVPFSLGGSIFILKEQSKGHTYKKGWEQW